MDSAATEAAVTAAALDLLDETGGVGGGPIAGKDGMAKPSLSFNCFFESGWMKSGSDFFFR